MAEYTMILMEIEEILSEIDAYVVRLRQARELLLASAPEAPARRVPVRKQKGAAKRTGAFSSKLRSHKSKSRTDRQSSHRKPVKNAAGALKERRSAAHTDPGVRELPSASTQPVQKETVREEVLPQAQASVNQAQPSIQVVRRVRTRPVGIKAPRRVPSTISPAAKPAIALAGPPSSRVVVVSAEQVKRERDQAARPEVRRPRVSLSGATGKSAFEALFKDQTERSNSSGE